MRPMQERAYEKRGEQYLLIKSPPASGKSRALMYIALDKLHHQGLRQAIIVVPEKSIGASFHDEPLSQFGFFAEWRVPPQWNLCNAPREEGDKASTRRWRRSGMAASPAIAMIRPRPGWWRGRGDFSPASVDNLVDNRWQLAARRHHFKAGAVLISDWPTLVDLKPINRL